MLLKSYAKINLSMDVMATLDNGYHTVSTVMQRTSLFDIVSVDFIPGDDDLQIFVSTNKPYIPNDERNLAYKAALLMKDIAESKGISTKGKVVIDIEKHIPVAAGLAGGSGNGAAVMILLNRLWNIGMDTKALCQEGKVLGADVPFMILVQNSRYRCALGEGLGDELTPLPGTFLRNLVLAKPNFGVSTKEVYKGIDEVEIDRRPGNQELIKALGDRDYETIYKNMINVLECYTLKTYPEVQKLKDKLWETQGVEHVLMSGSGPTVYAVYRTRQEAREACLKVRALGYEAYWTDTFMDKRRKND